MTEPVKGWKVFDSELKCRGHQFEVGKTYEISGPIEMCKHGWHFHHNGHEIFSYYKNETSNRICEIKAHGAIIGDDKAVCCTIEIIRELSFIEICFLIDGDGNGNGNGNVDGNGNGDGYGYGYGYGNGDGYGDGDGYGYGNGDGNGYGNGDGNGNGNGDGYGYGDGYGNGNVDGNGNGDGYGYGDGDGYGNGYGDGDGYGYGNGYGYYKLPDFIEFISEGKAA